MYIYIHCISSWRQFLEFIERVQPVNTGLQIPESKKPKDFVKRYPEPGSDWPRVQPAQNTQVLQLASQLIKYCIIVNKNFTCQIIRHQNWIKK